MYLVYNYVFSPSQALKDIDDQFYDALKHAKEIKQSEDDIQSIVAMHLKRVDEFMNIMYPSLQKNHNKKVRSLLLSVAIFSYL